MLISGACTDTLFYTTANSARASDTVNFIRGNGNREIWIGTHAGLIKINKSGVWTNYTHVNSQLPFDEITSGMVEADGTLWCVSGDQTLVHFNESVLYQKDALGLFGIAVTINAIVQDENNVFWIGSQGEELVRIKKLNKIQ